MIFLGLVVSSILLLCGLSAFPSVSRLHALGDLPFLIDIESTFRDPSQLPEISNQVCLEAGKTYGASNQANVTWPSGTPNAQFSMVYHDLDKTTWGLGLGHTNVQANTQRSSANANFSPIENPIHLMATTDWGGVDWAWGLDYAQSKKQGVVSQSQSYLELQVGRVLSWGRIFAAFVPTDQSEYSATGIRGSYNSDIDALLGVELRHDSGIWNFEFQEKHYKMDSNVNTIGTDNRDVGLMNLKLSWFQDFVQPGIKFYYGLASEYAYFHWVNMSEEQTLRLPVVIAIEVEVTNGLTARAHVSQLVFSQNQSPQHFATSLPHSTEVVFGLGSKVGTSRFDLSLQASQDGNVQGSQLGGELSWSYLF